MPSLTRSCTDSLTVTEARDLRVPTSGKVNRQWLQVQVATGHLTSVARNLIAKAHRLGWRITPSRFVLSGGRHRATIPWEPSQEVASPRTTLYMGSIALGSMILEEANASSLVVKCVVPVIPTLQQSSVLVYCRLKGTGSTVLENRDWPFATCVWPPWYLTTNQTLVARVVIPFGQGIRVLESTNIINLRHEDTVSVLDTGKLGADWVASCSENLLVTTTYLAVKA